MNGVTSIVPETSPAGPFLGGDRPGAAPRIPARAQVRGRFLYAGAEKLFVRGVTYGTFRPDDQGEEFHDLSKVQRDLAQIASCGFNAIRTYTLPPRWLLDVAQDHGLRVMVGVPWEQHVTFLDEPQRVRSITWRMAAGVSTCAGHPAVLCYSIGNEIPAPIVRWYGAQRVEGFLKRLYDAAKAEDPEGLVTYVNYPSTEYLRLPFVDLLCFNVYLESRPDYETYLARLHNLAGDRPLIMAEIGLDSRRNGERAQARSLEWQVRSALASGCAGAFVFSWTDEWHRGGHDIEDWDFGLTTRCRKPKPALTAVAGAFRDAPFPRSAPAPSISVVICTYNGSRTLRECLQGVTRLDYPNYEVIVVNDGSTDNSAAIASEFNCRLITTGNRGLSSARNTGLEAASGEIVAYLDDDASPDPDWLRYLAATFVSSVHCGVGGPNLPPPDDAAVAQCVANAPGGPNHVLLTDSVAEHIPGCNMAFRRSRLIEIGGFDPQFRAAGDDVDLCWRLQQKGWTIGFNPAAMVWHRRRNSVRAYWRQQKGYGAAEALLEGKWPEKYNLAGHAMWSGRLYGRGLSQVLGLVDRIYHGTWGTAPFQTLHSGVPSAVSHVPVTPEWLLIVLYLGVLSAMGLLWPKLLWFLPAFGLAAGTSVYLAAASAARASFPARGRTKAGLLGLRFLTFALHLLQPIARLWGRVGHGLMAGRSRVPPGLGWPVPRHLQLWSEKWHTSEQRLSSLESAIREEGGILAHGGPYDRWDLEVRGGLLAAVRLLTTVEEHGAGRQLFRFRLVPRSTPVALAAVLPQGILVAGAVLDKAWLAAALLSVAFIFLAAYSFVECASAMAVLLRALRREGVGRLKPAEEVASKPAVGTCPAAP